MRKVIIAVFLLASFVAKAQDTPYVKPVIYTNMASDYWFKKHMKVDSLFQARKGIFRDSVGFLGITTVPTALDADSNRKAANTAWVRKWISENVTPGTPSIAATGWGTSGNYASPFPLGYNLGTKDSFPLPFWTNGLLRFEIPADGITRKAANGANKMLIFDTVNKKVYYADVPAGGGGGSVGISSLGTGYGLINVNDSTYRVDTLSLATWGRLNKVSDSVQAINNTALNLKLNISDTASKWVGNIIVLNDSTIRVFEGASFTDLQILGKANAAGGSSGTVTSVATNNGTGITGGTITTTGTLAIDTLNISTKWNVKKAVDSLALINVTLTGTQTLTNKTLTAPKHTVQALTDGATITMDMANGDIGTVTLGGNRTLAFSNMASGMFATIYFTQDGTGSRTITLPASTKVIGGGAGAVTLTTAAGSVDVLTFNYVGTTLYCNYGKNYN